MKQATIALVAAAALHYSGAASANHGNAQTCSLGKLAGTWAFATEVGVESGAAAGITALGLFTVNRRGEVEGVFDATVENIIHLGDVTFEGTMTVGPDCRGELSFTTSTGATRTDSFIMLNRYELWGMSQLPSNLWTYRAQRLPGR